MRAHWKLLSGLGLASAVTAVLIVASGEVAGDTATPSSPASPAPDLIDQDPSTQYELGPGKILYEEQDAEEQANLDRMEEVTATGQGAASHEALARAAAQAFEQAQIEIATRQVGLTGTEDQGVVP